MRGRRGRRRFGRRSERAGGLLGRADGREVCTSMSG